MTDSNLYNSFAAIQIPGFDYHNFLYNKHDAIRIALVFSGGGYRSMLTGAGVLQAFDDRTPNSGYLGGLLQSITYIAGISGGSWLVMSNLVNDFKPVHTIIDNNETWSLQTQLLQGIPNFEPSGLLPRYNKSTSEIDVKVKPSLLSLFLKFLGVQVHQHSSSMNLDTTIFKTIKNIFVVRNSTLHKEKATAFQIFRFYNEIHLDVLKKKAKGFPVSLTDYWGRALSKNLFRTVNNPGITLSSCTELYSFRTFQQPFPIVCTIERDLQVTETSGNSHIFEITPFEFGSWDSYLHSFVPVKFLGTPLFAGFPIKWDSTRNRSVCYSGFDNVGFVTATSSSLFNQVIARIFDILIDFKLGTSSALETIFNAFGLTLVNPIQPNYPHPQYAIYSPNPFYGLNISAWKGRNLSKKPNLYFVDGGDDGQNIPFYSFIIPQRPIDLILSYDMSSDVNNFPNGSSLTKSAERFHNSNSTLRLPSFHLNGSSRSTYPYTPTLKQLQLLNLNGQPLFLGCNLTEDYPSILKQSMNTMDNSYQRYLPPLIIYQRNVNHSFPSNTSTFQLSYTKEQVQGMVTNGYNMATFKNSTYYTICIHCAILKREFDRVELGWNKHYKNHNFTVPTVCRKCFTKFCWHRDERLQNNFRDQKI